MICLVVPLSVTGSDGVVQWVVFRSMFCCNTNPVEGEGHETIADAFDRVMSRLGVEIINAALALMAELNSLLTITL